MCIYIDIYIYIYTRPRKRNLHSGLNSLYNVDWSTGPNKDGTTKLSGTPWANNDRMPRLGHRKFGLYQLGPLRRRSFVVGTMQYFEVDFFHESQMKAKLFTDE